VIFLALVFSIVSFQVFDQFEIYRAMLNATMNKEKYRIAARGGIAKVKTRFSWSAIVGKLVRTITSAT
jgi:hypothetical protein